MNKCGSSNVNINIPINLNQSLWKRSNLDLGGIKVSKQIKHVTYNPDVYNASKRPWKY